LCWTRFTKFKMLWLKVILGKNMRILLEAEVDAHISFPRANKDILAEVKVPSENIEFYLSNGNFVLGVEFPFLTAVLVFEGDSLESGMSQGRETIVEILQALAAVTSSTFKYRRAIKIVDWTEGNLERTYKVAKTVMEQQIPCEKLDITLIKSAMRIYLAQKKNSLSLAVHWFSSGISAPLPEDQFQFFWFVLETLAEHQKPSEKVHDKCQKCSSHLYCEKCQKYPTHKAFNKQIIEGLINDFFEARQSATTIKKLFEVRNMLMHGSRRTEIELEIGHEITISVNEIAAIARSTLFSTLLKSVSGDGPDDQIFYLENEENTHLVSEWSLNMTSRRLEATYENFEKIATPKIDILYTEEK
jgi:Apea-like HEPN